jgi:hypothetical protein
MNFGLHRGNRGVSNIAHSYHVRWQKKGLGVELSVVDPRRRAGDVLSTRFATTRDDDGRSAALNPASKLGRRNRQVMPDSEVGKPGPMDGRSEAEPVSFHLSG